jgi:rhomboid protease GluP
MCPHCRAFITNKDKICPYCDTPVGPRAIDLRDAGDMVAGIFPAARFVTCIILTLNVALYLVTVIASMKNGVGGGLMNIDVFTLLQYGASNPRFVRGEGQLWRLLTAGFLHGGIMHILFNSWALMDVGAHAETTYGPRRMIVIYVLSTVGGFFASAYFTGATSVGASAGLFGLIGAMIAVGLLHRSFEATAIKEFYIRWAIYGLLMGLLPMFRTDNAAHIGGLVTGFAAAYLVGLPRPWSKTQDLLWNALAGVAILVTAYAFLRMILFAPQFARLFGR